MEIAKCIRELICSVSPYMERNPSPCTILPVKIAFACDDQLECRLVVHIRLFILIPTFLERVSYLKLISTLQTLLPIIIPPSPPSSRSFPYIYIPETLLLEFILVWNGNPSSVSDGFLRVLVLALIGASRRHWLMASSYPSPRPRPTITSAVNRCTDVGLSPRRLAC